MIDKRINGDISEEFSILRNELKIHLCNDIDLESNKKFLTNHVPKEVLNKARILLDTLLNYLMDDALNVLKEADVDLKNLFYKEDFRGHLKKWSLEIENKHGLNSSGVEYSQDPRSVNGLIAGGITFVAGTAIAVFTFNKESTIRTIVTGFLTLLLSAMAYKVAFNKSDNAAREKINQDIENFLKSSESQTKEWMNQTIKRFSEDFESFCSKNNFEFKGKIE